MKIGKDLPGLIMEEKTKFLSLVGVRQRLSDCCNAPIVLSEGTRRSKDGLYFEGVRYHMCSKCNKPYHPNIIE